MSEAGILNMSAGGNAERVAELTPLIRRISRGLLGHAQDAEDAEQEACLRMLSGLASYEERGPFEAWVRRITVRTGLRILRRRRFLGWFLQELPVPAPPSPGTADPDVVARLQRSLDSLSGRERAAFVLKYQEGLPFAEVAAAMACREGTARNYAFRASEKLRRLMKGDA